MDVFVLGAGGTIGRGIAHALKARGHRVLGLSRSEATAARLTAAGVAPVAGDLRDPAGWAASALACDAVVHAAGTFTADMGAVEAAVADALLPTVAARGLPYVATGGVWLWPAARPGEDPADETLVEAGGLDPTPGFDWAPALLERVRASGGRVVHPAAVWTRDGALLDRLLDPDLLAPDLLDEAAVPIAGGPQVRWPLVEAGDLGRLYAAVLERAEPGTDWLAVAEPGTPQEELARAVERGLGRQLRRRVLDADALAALEGEIARGYARDLSLDGGKARTALGWQPSAGPAAEALERRARERA
jgi:nucleoside-diphosphate-sugar epimerase